MWNRKEWFLSEKCLHAAGGSVWRMDPLMFPTERVSLSCLKVHPRNYKSHPADQVAHIASSIREHGFYRNVVIARDGTILAGHGVVLASRELGLSEIPVVRLDVDPFDVSALKVLAGDNTLGQFGEIDGAVLSDVLREIREDRGDLSGTGYDDRMLASLAMVSRPRSELEGMDAVKEWVGMVEFEGPPLLPKLVITFAREEDRRSLVEELGLEITKVGGLTESAMWGGG